VHSAEGYKAKKSIIENLNAAYQLYELSTDGIWYMTLRGDRHPNDQRAFDLATSPVPGMSTSVWDVETRNTPWMNGEYLQKRLLEYRKELEKRAPYCLLSPVGLEVIGKRVAPPADTEFLCESSMSNISEGD
jgi:hypothetical protein